MSLSDIAAKLTAHKPRLEAGHVWLAGAGPGDPGLLTLEVLAALQETDALVHDALVSPEIIEVAGQADADGGHAVVVRVRGVKVLLPTGFDGVAADMEVQRMLAAGLEDEVVAGCGDRERVFAVARVEEEAVESGAGDDGVAVLEAGFPIAEDGNGGFAGGGDVLFVE